MKKLIVGVAAVGVALALRPLVKRRLVQKMRDHCTQMAAHCKEMMEGRGGPTADEAEAQEMRERCEEIAARRREDAEPVAAS
jgi:hypothetical protein